MAGRGAGKTRTGAEWIRNETKTCGWLGLAAPTADHLREVMIEGESGILACSPPWDYPLYEPSKSRLTWPNGARAVLLSADKPDIFRGKQYERVWADELAAWRYADDAFVQISLGLRLGDRPRGFISTTPRPIKVIKDLLKADTTAVTRGSTYSNRDNLTDVFYSQVISQYEGTRLARQEILGEVLDDYPGALWSFTGIDQTRVDKAPELRRIAVGVDPAVTAEEGSDETGIVVCGEGYPQANGTIHYYTLADLSMKGSPHEWASAVVRAYNQWDADFIVAETNNGGDMVIDTIKRIDPNAPVRKVTASRGKAVRAEPISLLMEQGRHHHVGSFPVLEEQMATWEQGDKESPDRMDAMVWAMSKLVKGRGLVAW